MPGTDLQFESGGTMSHEKSEQNEAPRAHPGKYLKPRPLEGWNQGCFENLNTKCSLTRDQHCASV